MSSLLMLATVPAKAEDPSANQIINSLQGKTKFRAFDPGQAQREKKQEELVTKLRGMKTRQITVEERKEIADVVKENDLPAIDLEVFFDYDSAAITQEALPILDKLGEALNSDKLKGSVFMVAGHTDGRGSAEYNLGLSNARAKSVREFLIKKFEIAPDQLVAVGLGEEQLKNAEVPEAGENRRVQVVNMANKDVAEKAKPTVAEPAEPKAKDEPADQDGAAAGDAPPAE
jgi:outer membrane protein OmpA-like peptidoglycan-associated protein